MGSFRILGASLREQRAGLAIALVAAVLAQGIGIPLPLLTRWLVNSTAATEPGGEAALPMGSLLWTGAAVVVLVALLRAGCRWLQEVHGERVAQAVLVDVRGRMYRHLQRLSQGYFDRRSAGQLVVRYVGDANALRTWLGRTLITTPADVLTVIALGWLVGAIHPELLIAVATPLAVLATVLLWLNPRARYWTTDARGHQTRLCGLLGERISAMGVTKAANGQEADHARVLQMLDAIAASHLRRSRVDAWSQAISVGATTTALGATGLWGATLYLDGVVNHGDLLAAIWLTVLSRGPVHRLARANTIHQRARISVQRIEALLARKPEPGWAADLSPYSGPGRTIEFRQVGYREAGGRWALRHLSEEIRGSALVAVTGGSARARGFLLELLLRLRRPHEGRIRLDGIDVRKLRVADLRRQMGWVDRGRRILGQLDGEPPPETIEPFQLERQWLATPPLAAPGSAGTLSEHLRPGGGDPVDPGMLSDSVQLRLALLLALRHDPPILLLDDPTMALDDGAVESLVAWLQEESRSRLIIVATHDSRILGISPKVITLRVGSADRKTAETRP